MHADRRRFRNRGFLLKGAQNEQILQILKVTVTAHTRMHYVRKHYSNFVVVMMVLWAL
jgi:hypothetical protein